jgi:uncharacterized protein YxjI
MLENGIATFPGMRQSPGRDSFVDYHALASTLVQSGQAGRKNASHPLYRSEAFLFPEVGGSGRGAVKVWAGVTDGPIRREANSMRYVLRQKIWSLGDDFRIQDAEGNTAFRVDGRVFSLGNKLSFQDASGRELAFIRQKLLSWGPTYFIEREGRVVAEVRKHLFTLFRCRFTVDVPGPDDLEAQGSFLEMEYSVTRHGRRVAEVSKRWFSWTDTYGVEVADGEDPVLILASAVVIDMVCHQVEKRD